jgi:hypothetical protein
MTIKISAAHRDAIYEYLLEHLSGIGDLWMVIQGKRYDRAAKLGQEFSDDIRLILDDLGWGEGPGRSIDLTAPADVLARVFGRLREQAAGDRESHSAEWAEARDLEERTRLVSEVCDTVLADLDGDGTSFSGPPHRHPADR